MWTHKGLWRWRSLSARIAAAEIDSEHIEHFMLVADTADLAPGETIAMEQRLNHAVANVGRYFACRDEFSEKVGVGPAMGYDFRVILFDDGLSVGAAFDCRGLANG